MGNSHACIGVADAVPPAAGLCAPSYRATKDEKDSTRGRARVLQELTRANGSSKDGWSSPEVREALDLCLSCKACSTDCPPTGVDIAEAKSELVDEYYRGRIRPFTHYSIGWLPRWLPLLTRVAPLANLGASFRPFRLAGGSGWASVPDDDSRLLRRTAGSGSGCGKQNLRTMPTSWCSSTALPAPLGPRWFRLLPACSVTQANL